MLKLLILIASLLVASEALFSHGRAHCGRRTYNPSFHLCCAGHVASKHGFAPSCCGTRVYDARFQLCCRGHVNSRFGIAPHCCGTRVYDAKFRKCHNGRVIIG